jgi:hypothetical protein
MNPFGKPRSVIAGREAVLHLVRFVVFAGLYLLLVETLQWPELLMCAGAAAVSVIAVAALSKHNDVHFDFNPRWLGAIVSVPRDIIVDTLLVLGSLFPMLLRGRASFGRFQRRHPREPVARAQLPAWRAFKIAQISTAPNTYVVDIQKKSGRILVHQLVDPSAIRRPKLP